MTVLRGIVSEMVHLFVDSGSLALVLVLWCAAVRLAAAVLPRFLPVLGPILFAGCAVILLVNVISASRSRAAGRRG